MGDLTANFSRKEFACKCGCKSDNINLELVEKLQRLRNETHIPLVIASGVRCPEHNKKSGGKVNSAHVFGLATDIRCLDAGTRFRLISSIFYLRLFQRVGIDKTFIHVDIDKTKPNQVIWMY